MPSPSSDRVRVPCRYSSGSDFADDAKLPKSSVGTAPLTAEKRRRLPASRSAASECNLEEVEEEEAAFRTLKKS